MICPASDPGSRPSRTRGSVAYLKPRISNLESHLLPLLPIATFLTFYLPHADKES